MFAPLLATLIALPAPPAAPVIVEEVQKAEMNDEVEALGTLKANESITLTATITDTISAIHFESGKRVKKGDILVELTSNQERAALAESRSRLAEARRQFERVQPLVETGAISGATFDQRRREFETAEARMAALRSQLADHIVTAPFSGIVGLRNISVGGLVRPGDVLTTLDDDSVMKLDFAIPETRLSLVSEGMEIEAKVTGVDGRSFSGTVESIDSRIDPVTRAVLVRALIPNDDHLLRPGQLMSVVLFSQPRETIVISEEAIVPEGRKHYVFVVADAPEGDGRIAERREVTIGTRRKGEVEILEGLETGEQIVTHGTIRVRPGGAVDVRAVQKGDEDLRELLYK